MTAIMRTTESDTSSRRDAARPSVVRPNRRCAAVRRDDQRDDRPNSRPDAVRVRAGAVADRSVAMSPALRAVRRSERSVSSAVYRRRRAAVGTVLAVCAAVGIVFAHDVLVGSGVAPAAAAASQPAFARGEVIARRGDTLWSIAEEYRDGVSIGRYVEELVALNGGASLQAGQRVVIP